MEDRRVFARIEAKLPLKFINPLGDKVGEGLSLDVSASGIGFETAESIPEEMPIEIWLDIPDHHGSLYARGVIVWAEVAKDKDKIHRVGVALEQEELLGLARVLWIKARS